MKTLRTFGEYLLENHIPGHHSEEDEELIRHYKDIDEQEEEYLEEEEESEGNDVSEEDAIANFMKKI